MPELLKTKTFWTGVFGILGAGAAYYTGQMDAASASQVAFTGLMGIFLRNGVLKAS